MNHLTSLEEKELNHLIPQFERREMDLGLERINNALQILGKPCSNIPAIHIAGTNGKGSIASFIQSGLKSAGIKTGITISPHLIYWNERISINGEYIPSKELIEILKEIKIKTKGINLTTFELLITTALKYFEISDIELIVLETGLGGRLDATTAHPYRPIIAIGGIGLDHCEQLGNNLTAITKEKAAIITPGSIVISANQEAEVIKVLNQKVEKEHAKLKLVTPLTEKWELGLKGNIQHENAAVAKAVLEELPSLGFRIGIQNIKEGFASASWPGRLEKAYWQNLPVLLDGAHNVHAAKELSKERMNWDKNQNCVNWILAIQKSKNAPLMLTELIKDNDLAWIVRVPNHKSWSAEILKENCPEISNQIYKANNVEEVLKRIKSKGNWPDPQPVIAGSLYLIGELLQKNIVSNYFN